MKRNSSLKQTKGLTAKTSLKANAKSKKRPKTEMEKLKTKANEVFAHYIRLRDADFVGGVAWQSECISCGRTNTVRYYDEDKQKWRWGRKEENGHFVGRGNWFLRFNEMNCNGQCTYCNKYKNGNNASYHKALDIKYGDGTAVELIELGETHKNYRITKQDLEQVIEASNKYLSWCYKREEEHA